MHNHTSSVFEEIQAESAQNDRKVQEKNKLSMFHKETNYYLKHFRPLKSSGRYQRWYKALEKETGQKIQSLSQKSICPENPELYIYSL